MRSNGVFIAGTDTGVGKTRVAVDLIRALVRKQQRVAAMKPVAAGADPTPSGLRNADSMALAAATNVPLTWDQVTPYCLPLAASPHIAAEHAGIRIETGRIVREYEAISNLADCVVVEGAGGWLAPIGERETMADVAVALGLPVVLVVGLRLGCLNHALLTAQAIERTGLRLAGWVANACVPDFIHARENIATLEQRLGAPLLDSVPFDQSGFTSAESSRRLGEALGLW
jgi:dethiobiotin synthetase